MSQSTGREHVAVVGGGPAGLMAAEVLATAGVHVAVFERMRSVGRKFQLAGRGGLNLTHSEPLVDFLERYGPSRRRLAPAIEAFGPDALRAWCAELGEGTFVGSSGRVFPASFRSTSLLRAWLGRLGDLGVEFRVGHEWRGWGDDDSLAFLDAEGAPLQVRPDAVVLALGGASWPRVGSDGSWVRPLQEAGIAVSPLRPANCGFVVEWTDVFRSRFEGQPLKDVRLSHGTVSARGDIVVTRTGIEGGAVYALSAALRDAIDTDGSALVEIDLRPELSVAELAPRLVRRRPKDSAATGLRRAGLVPLAVGLLREAAGVALPSDAGELAELAKAIPVVAVATQPIERAISTAGGVALDEIDGSFMLWRRPGTFVAGEMLDWEAPTGGYLLQATFSTAVAAAAGALAWLGSHPDPRS